MLLHAHVHTYKHTTCMYPYICIYVGIHILTYAHALHNLYAQTITYSDCFMFICCEYKANKELL